MTAPLAPSSSVTIRRIIGVRDDLPHLRVDLDREDADGLLYSSAKGLSATPEEGQRVLVFDEELCYLATVHRVDAAGDLHLELDLGSARELA